MRIRDALVGGSCMMGHARSERPTIGIDDDLPRSNDRADEGCRGSRPLDFANYYHRDYRRRARKAATSTLTASLDSTQQDCFRTRTFLEGRSDKSLRSCRSMELRISRTRSFDLALDRFDLFNPAETMLREKYNENRRCIDIRCHIQAFE